jgi:CelD/BcsL family acetyltransferase involved in cellulose biosynthesis
MFKIEVIDNIQDIYSLQSEWDNVVNESPDSSIFQTYEYITTWWKHFGGKQKLNVLIIRDRNESVISIIPFYQKKKKGFKVYMLVGDDYADYIHIASRINPNQLAKVLYKYLKDDKDWHWVEFNGVVKGSVTDRFVNELSRKQFKKIVDKTVHFAPLLNVSNDWEVYYNEIDKKTRKDVEYNKRRLNKIGQLTVRDIQDEEIDICLIDFFAMHKHRYANEETISIFENKKNRDFITELTKTLAKKKWLHFSKLTLADETLSMHLGFLLKNKFYYYLPVFNDKYSKYSSGKILLLELIRESFNKGHRNFDFMAGKEKYKYLYSNNEQKIVTVKLFRKSFFGYTFLYLKLMFERVFLIINIIMKK